MMALGVKPTPVIDWSTGVEVEVLFANEPALKFRVKTLRLLLGYCLEIELITKTYLFFLMS
jgi:hypothetical protein